MLHFTDKIFSKALLTSILLASCSFQQPADEVMGVGSFFDDHVAVLEHLPCDAVGGYNAFDVNPTNFSCLAGQWGEVSMRLNHNGAGKTKDITLFWRVYPENSFFVDANDTVLPFFDFITQRYAKGSESAMYDFLKENEAGRMKLNGLRFEHTVHLSEEQQTMFDQHKLVINTK